MSKKRKKVDIVRPIRNWDAQEFIRRAKHKKRQEAEIAAMNRSFEVRDETELRFEYAVSK